MFYQFTLSRKNDRFLLILALLFFLSGCHSDKKRNISSNNIEILYYSDSLIRSITQKAPGNIEVEIKFKKNAFLKSIVHYVDTIPIGYYSLYETGHLYHQRQYIYLNGKTYINQYWNIDEMGNIEKNRSNFFTIYTSKDTATVNTPWNMDIFLECPYFGGDMEVEFGNFDENFNVIDSTSIVKLKGVNHHVKKTFVFNSAGKKIIRAIIYDYDQLISDTTKLLKVRKLYLTKMVTVIDNKDQ